MSQLAIVAALVGGLAMLVLAAWFWGRTPAIRAIATPLSPR